MFSYKSFCVENWIKRRYSMWSPSTFTCVNIYVYCFDIFFQKRKGMILNSQWLCTLVIQSISCFCHMFKRYNCYIWRYIFTG